MWDSFVHAFEGGASHFDSLAIMIMLSIVSSKVRNIERQLSDIEKQIKALPKSN
jgi:hypothetical protein